MIKTFRNRETTDIAEGLSSKLSRRLLPVELHRNALLKISLVNRAKVVSDLSAPGLRLENLKGNRKGQYSLRINQQYRICFEWREDGAYTVEIVDYH